MRTITVLSVFIDLEERGGGGGGGGGDGEAKSRKENPAIYEWLWKSIYFYSRRRYALMHYQHVEPKRASIHQILQAFLFKWDMRHN